MKKFLVALSVFCVAQVISVPVGINSDRTSNFSLSNSIATFNNKLYEKISQIENGNIFYSPFGLHLVLSQTFLGSAVNSRTHEELANLLDLNVNDTADYLNQYFFARNSIEAQISRLHKGSIVRIANKIFAAQDLKLKQNFKQSMEKYFLATVEQVHFEDQDVTADKINTFVKNETRGLIRELFKAKELDALTRLIMVNAIYFKGEWQHQFNKSQTTNLTFHVDNSTQTQFSAMSLTKKLRVQQIGELGAEVLELPYNNNRTSLLVVLPNYNVPVQDVETKLKNYKLTSLYETIANTDDYEVHVVLPKFETSYEVNDLDEIFKSLGVETLFDDFKANLSAIADEQLSVTKIVHKAVIKIDEEGSEAAAVSGVQAGTRIGPLPFVVDRPFIFYIYDRPTNLTLFVGRIVDPNGELRLKQSQGLEVKPVGFADVRSNVIDSVPCNDLGYNISGTHPESIRLPCHGYDTINLQEIEDHHKSIRDERLANFNSNKKTSKTNLN